jgi:hypothetical protein
MNIWHNLSKKKKSFEHSEGYMWVSECDELQGAPVDASLKIWTIKIQDVS